MRWRQHQDQRPLRRLPRVAAGKRTRPRKGCGRDHIPQRLVTGRITYIGDAADIMLGGPAGAEKVQLNGRDDPTWHHMITWIVELQVRSYRTRYPAFRNEVLAEAV
jgi:hypothetical protein